MQITRQHLFESSILRVSHVCAKPPRQAVELESQSQNVVVLPLAGAFAKQDSSTHSTLITPAHVGFIGADKPYRITYPDGRGDSCLTLRFSNETLIELVPNLPRSPSSPPDVYSGAPLPPAALAMRSLLARILTEDNWDPLALEEMGLGLAQLTLAALCRTARATSTGTRASRASVMRAKELLAVQPNAKWSLTSLGRAAGLSPFHLARAFRAEVGTTVYQYLLRIRLASAITALLDSEAELTEIAAQTGFANHSHLTARFRASFGVTPSSLRKGVRDGGHHEVRRIMTALDGWH